MLLGFLFLILTLLLFAGIQNPKSVIRWEESPTQGKVFLYWMGGVLILVVLAGFGSDPEKEAIEKGKALLAQNEYADAISVFERVDSSHELYAEAQQLIDRADSLKEVELTALKERRKKELKQRLEQELQEELLNGGSSPDGFRESLEALELELALFSGWADMVREARNSGDEEIQQMGEELKRKAIAYQKRAFPQMRKKYAELIDRKLWEENIDVRNWGRRNTTLDFVGGLFASNKNIKETQSMLHNTFNKYRFKRIQYRWVEHDREYTYYTLETPDDGVLR